MCLNGCEETTWSNSINIPRTHKVSVKMHRCPRHTVYQKKKKKLALIVALCTWGFHVRSEETSSRNALHLTWPNYRSIDFWFAQMEPTESKQPMWSLHIWARANERVNALVLKTYNATIWASQMEAMLSKHCTQRCREWCFITPFQHQRCFERHLQTLQMRCIIDSITTGAHGADSLISRLRGRVDFSWNDSAHPSNHAFIF